MSDVLVVDRQGLARKIANKPKAFILYELLQNAFDEDVSCVKANASFNNGICRISVEDDNPEGFADMRSIYTLFRDSKKAPDPTKRGRFELGEKMVIALAIDAKITTTKGSVIITENERYSTNEKRNSGTLFEATFKMLKSEYDKMVKDVFRIMPPVPTYFNGEAIPARKLLDEFIVPLTTVRCNNAGLLSTTTRNATVEVIERYDNEPAMIYEMGLPIVETGDKWHYNVMQRVPLNWERDNVPKSYLKTLRVFVLNNMHKAVDENETSESWVRQASSDIRCAKLAFEDVMNKRFGDKKVVRDPTDPESANKAMASGYEVINGRSLSRGEWINARQFESIPTSSKLFPTSRAYSKDPNAKIAEIISPEKYTPGMKKIVEYTKEIGSVLLDKNLKVLIVKSTNNFLAAFIQDGPELHFNLKQLGTNWFDQGISMNVDSLFIHELAHNYESNHLSSAYHDACCMLGAKMKKLAIETPNLFAKWI